MFADDSGYYRFISFPWNAEQLKIDDSIEISITIKSKLLNNEESILNVFWGDNEELMIKTLSGIATEMVLKDNNGKKHKAFIPRKKIQEKTSYIKLSEQYYDIALKKLTFWQYLGEHSESKVIITRKTSDLYVVTLDKSQFQWEVRTHNGIIQQVIFYNNSEAIFFASFYSQDQNYALYSFQLQKNFIALFYPFGGLKGLVILNDSNESIKVGYEWNDKGEIVGKRDFDKNPFNKNEIKIIK
jgi:hypothetical protein